MKKITIILILFISAGLLSAQEPSLQLKAFQRYHLSGLPPTPVIEIGGKETVAKSPSSEPDYFIYLLIYKMPFLTLESVWIRKHLYKAELNKVACKPVLLSNGIQNDTLVRYTDEEVWQINITGKVSAKTRPAKSISTLVAGNELLVRLRNKQGRYYTRSVKYITNLESSRGQ